MVLYSDAPTPPKKARKSVSLAEKRKWEKDALDEDYVFPNQMVRRHVASAWLKNMNPEFDDMRKGLLTGRVRLR